MTPLGLLVYRTATYALAPAIPLALKSRLKRGKEDGARLGERLGHASRPRPEGQLIWIHGASVGECLSVLPLIGELLKAPNRHVLVTSGTVTSSRLMDERLPQGAFHQYAPLDTPGAIARFIGHWKPDIGLFVDSEIWPNMLGQAKKSGAKLAMINGRMSERSFKGWRYAPKTAAAVIGLFDLCLAADEATAVRLRELGARDVRVSGNLKADAPPLPADPAKLGSLRAAIGSRPVLLASSTHAGEEESILPAHDILRRTHPDLLTIIVPRHPERGPDIAMLCGTRAVARRSEGSLPMPGTAIYVADTMGELGLFYRLAPIAFVGGSLVQHGGQNPLEPARLHCAVMAGPHTGNFTISYDAIFAAQGEGRVHSSGEIAALAGRLFADPAAAHALGDAAARGADRLGGAMERTRIAVENMLSHAPA
ncbi:MAG TPA: 3-deoxy-D-manno-octulosonic acid transferase [Rhizomicrobium sp.]|jgi:3-deoxy-D-manno-octulosonic-acid transferase|nr:3-deoxy-D-manno-octulosonic acid transferase [Rhizomicrobium sp.]